jgi:hypothetical protein
MIQCFSSWRRFDVDPFLNPAHDPNLLDLKRIAEAGGDRGPFYDQGVLFVVRQVETEGHFVRNPVCGILTAMLLQQQHKTRLLTEHELAQGQRFLAECGWTLEQGAQYARGLDCAQNLLSHFRRDDHQ